MVRIMKQTLFQKGKCFKFIPIFTRILVTLVSKYQKHKYLKYYVSGMYTSNLPNNDILYCARLIVSNTLVFVVCSFPNRFLHKIYPHT